MTTSGRSGYADFATLLRMVVDEHGTTSELAQRYHTSENKLRFNLNTMLGGGLVLVEDWRGDAPVWAFDREGSVPLASIVVGTGRGSHIGRFCLLVAALRQNEPQAFAALRSLSGIDQAVLRDLLRFMCDEVRLAYIASWRMPKRRGGNWLPHYLFGVDRDSAPHPRAERERMKALRKRPGRAAFAELLFTTAGKPWPPSNTTNEERTS